MMENQKLMVLAEKMACSDPAQVKAVIGFDGFVDQVVHVVDKRLDTERYERVKTLTEYGQKFIDAAGLSLNLEMVPITRKLGGVGVIFANSLATLGFGVTYIGALGKEGIHPVFQDMAKKARLISISDPGMTDAVEFYDGKVISCKLEPLKDVNWKNLTAAVAPSELAAMLDDCDFIGFADWSLVFNVTEIWQGILDEVFPLMKNTKRRKFLFDLSDPQKRTAEDIMAALKCIEKYEDRFEVTLGLNAREGYEVAELFGKSREEFDGALQVAEFLKEKITVSTIVVHPVKEACAAGLTGSVTVEGPYCEKPKLTTGAGDNFNAGFVLGQMLGFTLEESLLLGTANSGYYVRHGQSAGYPELIQFVRDWSRGRLDKDNQKEG